MGSTRIIDELKHGWMSTRNFSEGHPPGRCGRDGGPHLRFPPRCDAGQKCFAHLDCGQNACILAV